MCSPKLRKSDSEEIRYTLSSFTGNNDFVAKRLLMVRLTVVAGLLAGMGLSWPLWLTRTDYPRVPAVDFIPALPRPLDILLLIAFGVALAFLAARPESRWVAGIAFSTAALLVLQDQSRLQPWFIEYLLLLAAVTFSGKETAALKTENPDFSASVNNAPFFNVSHAISRAVRTSWPVR